MVLSCFLLDKVTHNYELRTTNRFTQSHIDKNGRQ
jgi:hypothetical protein